MHGPAYSFEIMDKKGHFEKIVDSSYESAIKRFCNGKHADHGRFFKQKSDWKNKTREFRCLCGEMITARKTS